MDAIVSWNMDHIVHINTKLRVREITRRYHYKDIEIVTPEEVIAHETE